MFSLRFESHRPSTDADQSTVELKSPSRPATVAELLNLPANDVVSLDIGMMNLLCAQGLRGSETLDLTNYLARLDGIAQRVESETKRHYYQFRNNPAKFEHSEGYFRMLLLAVTLQEDLGMRYNPDRIRRAGEFEENNVFFADSRDVFLHGLIAEDSRMGTCASMPVLYVAIGRRLGYPVKLVPTQNHLFVRWEDSRERFNVDATAQGMNRYDDEHYRQWPIPITHEIEREFGYLKSMTPAEELTTFLSLRGHCLTAMGLSSEGIAMQEQALRYSPDSRLQQLVVASAHEYAKPQGSVFDYLPPEQRPNWPQPRQVVVRQPDTSGVQAPIPPDPNPLKQIGNQ